MLKRYWLKGIILKTPAAYDICSLLAYYTQWPNVGCHTLCLHTARHGRERVLVGHTVETLEGKKAKVTFPVGRSACTALCQYTARYGRQKVLTGGDPGR